MRKNLPNEYYLHFFGLFIAYFIWAIAGPVIKITLEYVPPYTFLFVRFLVIAIVLLPYTLIMLSKHKINPKDYINFVLMGIFSQTSIILIFLGLKFTSVIDAVLIGAVGPLLTVAAGHYFFKEKISKTLIYGLIITIIGTLIVVIEPLISPEITSIKVDPISRLLGNFFVILNTLAFTLYVTWSKISLGKTNNLIKRTMSFIHLRPMHNNYPSSLIMAISMYVGMFTLAPFAVLENTGIFGNYQFDLTLIPVKAVFGILYMALFSSIAAYFLFEWALEKIGVIESSLMSYIGPILAFPFAYLLLGEIPTTGNMIGAIVIAVGVVIGEMRIKKR